MSQHEGPRGPADPTGHPGSDPGVDALDRSIDDIVAGRLDAVDADAVAVSPVLQRVRTLAATPLPPASRTRHLRTIRTHTPAGGRTVPGRGRRPAPAGPRRSPRLRPRVVGVVSVTLTALLMLGGGTIAAAQEAPPDAALYGVKRASEQVWLLMPRSNERAAEVQLALAERRIDEAFQRPEHAERLIAEGVENVESAAEERPQDAIDDFARLLGDGPDSLPPSASPVARAALHRNCQRIADRHGLDAGPCGPAPAVEHPGRGAKPDLGERGRPGGPPGLGDGERSGPRGWGPGGRPDGAVGPPPGTPAHGRERGSEADG